LEKKIKVLTLSDHPLSPSGVGTQTKYMCEALLSTGRYQIISLGGAIKHQDYTPKMVDPYKEDWKIINELAAKLKRKNLYINKEALINSMLNYINLYKDRKDFNIPKNKFIEEKIFVDDIDYYHSNSIARASKTMTDCKNLISNIKKTGTEG